MKRTSTLTFAVTVVLATLVFTCHIGLFPAPGVVEAQAATAASPAPQHQTEAEEVPAVEIPVEKQQMIGVKTVIVSMRPMQTVIRTVGRIDYDERGLATINTKFEGWIEKLFFNITGSSVKKGQPLAEIYSP